MWSLLSRPPFKDDLEVLPWYSTTTGEEALCNSVAAMSSLLNGTNENTYYWLIVLLVRSALGPKTFTITSNQVTPWSLWTRHSNHWQGHELVFLTVCSTRISAQSALLENVTATASNARGKELARPSLHWASMALWICYPVFSLSLKKLPLLHAWMDSSRRGCSVNSNC